MKLMSRLKARAKDKSESEPSLLVQKPCLILKIVVVDLF